MLSPRCSSASLSQTTDIAHITRYPDDVAATNSQYPLPTQIWLQEPGQCTPWHGISSYQLLLINATPLPAPAAKWEDIRVRSTGKVGDEMNEMSGSEEYCAKLMELILIDKRACTLEVSYMER